MMIDSVLLLTLIIVAALSFFVGVALGRVWEKYVFISNQLRDKQAAHVDNYQVATKPSPITKHSPVVSDNLTIPKEMQVKEKPKSSVMKYHTPTELQAIEDTKAFEEQIKSMEVKRESGTFVW